MNCTPHKCPYRELMEQARAACLACTHTTPAGHSGVISYEAAGERIVERERDKSITADGRGNVTALPPEVEEKLLHLLHGLTSLDPVDALLALHVANRGTVSTFGKFIVELVGRLKAYAPERKGFRATAHERWKNIKERFADLAVLQSWTARNK